MEWASQEKELTPDMVHTSHLWAVYPGDEIAWNKDSDLFDAAKKALYSRIEHGARSFWMARGLAYRFDIDSWTVETQAGSFP